MSFREIIVSKLGTPHDPFGWDVGLVIIAVIAVVIGFEWLLGRGIWKLASRIWKYIVAQHEAAWRQRR
ncbi:hypothetical protein BH11PSE6_BH11PSE6_14820 [soil metagenome]